MVKPSLYGWSISILEKKTQTNSLDQSHTTNDLDDDFDLVKCLTTIDVTIPSI